MIISLPFNECRGPVCCWKVNSNQRSNSLSAKGLDNYMHPRSFGMATVCCCVWAHCGNITIIQHTHTNCMLFWWRGSFWSAFVIIRSFCSEQQVVKLIFRSTCSQAHLASVVSFSHLSSSIKEIHFWRDAKRWLFQRRSRGEGRQPACPCCYARCLPITWDFITRWICEWGRRYKQRGWENHSRL
jgi:hypothetical protein